MTPFEVGTMLSLARRYDGRRPVVTTQEANDWHALLTRQGIADSPYQDLEEAVTDHYGRSRDWMMPHDVVVYCKRLRRDRLKAAGNLYALVDADPDDGPAVHAAYQRLHREIASGARDATGQIVDRPKPDLRILESGR